MGTSEWDQELTMSGDTCIQRIANEEFRRVLGDIGDWALTLPHDPTVQHPEGYEYCLGCAVGQSVQRLALDITDAEKAHP